MSGWVYTQRLEGGNFNVGFTRSLEYRIAQHFLGRGADWTRLYTPLEVVAVVQGDEELEQAQTIELMCRVGWRKVRGGRYTSPALSSQPIALSAAMAKAVPQKAPRPAFVEEVHLLGGHALRVYETIDGEIVGLLCGSTGETRFEGGDADGLIDKAVEWLNERTGEVKTVSDGGLHSEGSHPLPAMRQDVEAENSRGEARLQQEDQGTEEGPTNGP